MIDVFVLDSDLQVLGVVDEYKSLIWARRYNAVGDCELYLPATAENLSLLGIGNYLQRADDEMVCRIEKIEIDTDADNGNYLIVTGRDVCALLDQRVLLETVDFKGLLEDAIRTVVDGCLGVTATAERQIQDSNGNTIFGLGTAAGFTQTVTAQSSYKNLGEKVRDFCTQFGWGYRVRLEGREFLFELYSGTDRSGAVKFSPEFENLISSQYVNDWTKQGNVALVAGEGEGARRSKVVAGAGSGIDRYELFVDARDVTREITYGELKEAYPLATGGAQGGHVGGDASTGFYYYEDALIIKIYSADQQAKLQALYPNGHVIIAPAGPVFSATNVKIAEWTLAAGETLTDDTVVTLRDEIYDPYLYERGLNEMAKYGPTETFNSVIEPNMTYVYGQDYFLGDIVRIENEYGIGVDARIAEVVEVNDGSGYSVQPKFEYKE